MSNEIEYYRVSLTEENSRAHHSWTATSFEGAISIIKELMSDKDTTLVSLTRLTTDQILRMYEEDCIARDTLNGKFPLW